MRGFSIEDRIVNFETGEVVTHHTRRRINPENDYSKIYSDKIEILFELPKTQRNMLDLLGKYMSYAEEGQAVVISSCLKEEIERKCGVKRNSINKALVSMVKSGILRRKELNVYQVNPYIMGKGAWEDVRRLREEW